MEENVLVASTDYESGFLHVVDTALDQLATDELFIWFDRSFKEVLNQHPDEPTPEIDGRVYDLHARGRGMRQPHDIIDALMLTAVGGPALTEEEREDGYRTLDEFFDFLRLWRSRYRREFGR
jgi:hypothetical protein